jgi:hypothetical protein
VFKKKFKRKKDDKKYKIQKDINELKKTSPQKAYSKLHFKNAS